MSFRVSPVKASGCVGELNLIERSQHSFRIGALRLSSNEAETELVDSFILFVLSVIVILSGAEGSWALRDQSDVLSDGDGLSSAGGRAAHQEASIEPDIFIQGPKIAGASAASGSFNVLIANAVAMPPF